MDGNVFHSYRISSYFVLLCSIGAIKQVFGSTSLYLFILFGDLAANMYITSILNFSLYFHDLCSVAVAKVANADKVAEAAQLFRPSNALRQSIHALERNHATFVKNYDEDLAKLNGDSLSFYSFVSFLLFLIDFLFYFLSCSCQLKCSNTE